MLTQSRETAIYFETLVADLGSDLVKIAANWTIGELAAALNRDNIEIAQSPVKPDQLAKLLTRVVDGTINAKQAKEDVFREMWEVGKQLSRDVTVQLTGVSAKGEVGSVSVLIEPDAIIKAKGLKQISDAGAIEKIVDQVLAANAKQVEDYRGGKGKAFNSLVGQVMKATQGKANPAQVNEILKRKLTA